jgi:uncharacterized protein (DUF2147 family)
VTQEKNFSVESPPAQKDTAQNGGNCMRMAFFASSAMAENVELSHWAEYARRREGWSCECNHLWSLATQRAASGWMGR